jgi:cellulose synthase/poly-beta-1,6-N-acetylglucosamine synthase-like glycosyltransferase
MKNLVAEYPNLRYTIITKDAKFSHGKKLALTIGIKGAKHSVLLLTDADCAPSSEKWLHRLTSPLAQGYEIVLGYGKFQPKKTFLNRLIRYDAFFIAQQYLGTALMGIPYMGVGRNLAYKKEVYVRQGGFSKHAHIESGDDDLLINAAANKSNCTIEIHPDAHTISKAPETFKRWKHQKSRHLKASALYKKSHKIILALEPLSRILVWLAPIPLFFYHEWQMLALALSLSRFTIFMTVSKLNMRKLHEKGLWILSPLFDIVLPFLTLSFLIKSRLRKKTTVWK